MGHAESAPDTIGCITLDVKQTGKPGAGNRRAGFDEAGAGNVTKGAGLRANAKVVGIATGPYRRRASSRPHARDFLFKCASLSVREPRDPGRDRCPPPLPGAGHRRPCRRLQRLRRPPLVPTSAQAARQPLSCPTPEWDLATGGCRPAAGPRPCRRPGLCAGHVIAFRRAGSCRHDGAVGGSVAGCSERLASGRRLPSRPGARWQGLRPIRFASGSGRLGCYRCRPPGQRASAPRASLLTTTTITSPVPYWRSSSIVLTIRCSATDATRRSSSRSTSAPRPGSPGRRRSIGRATGCGCGGARQEHGAVGKAPSHHREVLALTWATGYTRPRMGTDAIQPNHRRPVMHPTTRLPRAASLSANPVAADPVAADRSAPVLTAAPLIRVAHTRRADVPRTADHVCRNVSARPTANDVGRDRHRHQSTPAGAAGSKKQIR